MRERFNETKSVIIYHHKMQKGEKPNMNQKRGVKDKKSKNSVNLGAVTHTHTHTQV